MTRHPGLGTFLLIVFAMAMCAGCGAERDGATATAPKIVDWQEVLVKKGAASGPESSAWPFEALTPTAMPPPLISAAISSLGGHERLGLHFDQAEKVAPTAHFDGWLVRGNGVTCMFQGPNAAAVCGLEAMVRKRGLTLVVGEGKPRRKGQLARRFHAYGVMPNSVRAVRLRPLESRQTTVTVVKNTFEFTAEAPIKVTQIIRR
jgi:hypothetical protein